MPLVVAELTVVAVTGVLVLITIGTFLRMN
jgi:hypothetical protein